MANITKLATFPASPEARKAISIPEGFRLSILGFKTTKVEGKEVKRDSEAWIIPMLHNPVLTDASKVEAMVADMIDDEQDSLLRAYSVEGKIELAEAICNLESLAVVYFTDGRGNRTGIKQEVLIKWVNTDLKNYLDSRILRNMPTRTQQERDNLVSSLLVQLRIAASRGNKVENKSLTLAPLEDLQKRLEQYSTDENAEYQLPLSDELAALQSRIEKHIKDIKQASEVTVETF